MRFTVVTHSFVNLGSFETIEEAEALATRFISDQHPKHETAIASCYIQVNETGTLLEFGDTTLAPPIRQCYADNCQDCNAGLNSAMLSHRHNYR